MTLSKEMLDMLVCPLCKGDLTLKTDAGVTDKSLYCGQCDLQYDVENGIPIMLPPELRIHSEQMKASGSLSVKWANIDLYVNREKERDKWENQPGKRLWLPRLLDFTFRYLDKPNGKVLDAGCGVGMLSSYLSDRGFKPTCFDISKDCITAVRKDDLRLKNSVVADAEHMPFREHSFNGVCFLGSLHHLPNAKKGLSEAFRVLKNGGRAILIENNSRRTGIMAEIITITLKLILQPNLGMKELVLAYKKLFAKVSKQNIIEYQGRKYKRDSTGRWIIIGETDQEITIPYVLNLAKMTGFKVLDVRTQQILITLATFYKKDISYRTRGRLQRIDRLLLERIPILNKYGDQMLVALEK